MGKLKKINNNKFLLILAILLILGLSGSADANTNYNYTQVSPTQDIDSNPNIGYNQTSTTNSQIKDGSFEEILEENKGNYEVNDYSLDTGSSNVDGIDNTGSANNIVNAQDKDSTYLNITEEVSTKSLDAQGAYFLVGGGTTDFSSSAGTIEFWVNYDVIAGRVWGQHTDFEMRFSGTTIQLDFGTGFSIAGTKLNWVTSHWYSTDTK